MKIAAIYARVSSERQQQQETIASQLAALREYAEAHDYQVSPQHVYQDDGCDSRTLDRPELDRLRDAAAQGELEAVLMLEPDRLTRKYAYQYLVVEELERAGCQVVFTKYGFGNTPEERLLREVTSVFAEYEHAQITERCRRGRLYRARQGQLWMKEAPYGYTYLPRTEHCPGKLLINEAEADLVRNIFAWLINEQLSTCQITRRLNQAGIRTRHGLSYWSPKTVAQIVRNTVHKGVFHYNKKQHIAPQQRQIRKMPAEKGASTPLSSCVRRPREEWIAIPVPALIDEQTWELAQEQLQINRERAGRNNKKHDYLLRSLLVCGHCQVRLTGRAGPRLKPRIHYSCPRKSSLRAPLDPCPGRSVAGPMMEELVWQSVSQLLRDPQLLVEQYQLRQDQDYGTPQQQELQRLERRLVALKGEEQRLLDAFQAGLIELQVLKERSQRLAEEDARLRQRGEALKQQRQEQQRQATLGATVEDFCRNIGSALDNPSFETKRRILSLVVDKIEVLDDQITIKHMIPTSNVHLQLNQSA
jgi:site-specific DNA recombinase